MKNSSLKPIDVVCAADEAFALPLAVTVRSVLSNLCPTRRMRLFVLDGGLSDTSKDRLLASWRFRPLEVHWISPDVDLVAGLQISRHVNLVTYFRLLMPWAVPEHVGRAIYLDADLLVRRDLANLWDQSLEGVACLAAADTAAPCLDARLALPNYRRVQRFLAAAEPVPNYRELGLRPQARYFNAGVLLVDLDAWRASDVGGRALACLRQHESAVRWWDQYALNVVLADNWRELDPRWNQGVHANTFPTWRESPFEREMFHALRSEPWVVHFTSHEKPWHYYCRHPFRGAYLAEVDRTQWRGWRPGLPRNDVLKMWWRHRVAPLRHAVKVGVARVRRFGNPPARAA